MQQSAQDRGEQTPEADPATWLPERLPAQVADQPHPDEVFDRFARLVTTALGVPVALVSLVTTQGQVLPGAVGLPQPWQESRCTGLSHSFCQHVVARDAPLVVTDAREDPRLADNRAVDDLGVIAYAGFPLHDADGSPVGSLCAIDTRPREWTPRELSVLADLAATASSELALRRAAQRDERDTARVAALGRLALSLTDAESVDDLAVVMAEEGHAALGADGGAVATPHDDGLLSYISSSLGQRARTEYSHLPLSAELPVTHAAKTRTRVLVTDQAAAEAYSPALAAVNAATGCQAWASLPLVAQGHLLGVLSVGWKDPQRFEPEQVDLLETCAAQCAQALWRLQARDAERRAAEAERVSARRQASLAATAQALAGAASHEEVLAVLHAQGAALLGAVGTGLRLLEADSTRLRTLATDGFDDSAGSQEPGTDAGVRTSASVPLRAGRGQLGSLSVTFAQARPWTAEEHELLEAFAAMTAQALDRVAAHDAERAALAEVSDIAQTLQRSMLTAPPHLDHLQVAVRYTATAQTAEVGGDWYDAFLTSDGLTSLVIGDVTGHDMAAAAVMGQLRNLLRGIGFTLGGSPAAVLTALDRAAAGLGADTVATAVLAQVEQDEAHRAAGTLLLRWSNAGHPPPLLVGADGAASFLERPADLLLGWDPGTPRHDHEHLLAPGSTVLLYTDGLVERRGVGVDPGLAWLAGAASELATTPGVTLDDLCDGLVALVGGHLDDDVALLALRVRPDGPAA